MASCFWVSLSTRAFLLAVMPSIFSYSMLDWAFFQQNSSDQLGLISIHCSRGPSVCPFTTLEVLAVPLCRLAPVFKVHHKQIDYVGPTSKSSILKSEVLPVGQCVFVCECVCLNSSKTTGLRSMKLENK